MAISTAVDINAVARVVGIKTEFVNLFGEGVVTLPQRIAVFGQGNDAAVYSTDKRQVRSEFEAGDVYGFGSPVHLVVKQLLPRNGDGVGIIPVTVYPLEAEGGATPAVGEIEPAGVVTDQAVITIKVSEVSSTQLLLEVGDVVADVVTKITDAINAILEMPVIATDNTTDVIITTKWSGTSAGQVGDVEVIGGANSGMTFVITQPVGAALNPDVQPAIDQIGEVWETLILNLFGLDTTILDAFEFEGEGRWNPLVRRPFTAWSGNSLIDPAIASAISEGRPTDRINGHLTATGSKELNIVTAARQMARIAKLANTTPPHDYGSQVANGVVPGADGDQWSYIDRDFVVKRGCSTTEKKDGQLLVSDVVTFYHPTGDPTPAYRYLVDIVKVSNILFNLDLIFKQPEWDGAPLIPDDQATTEPTAKKPRAAVAAVNGLIDSLALAAIISDPETAKGTTQAGISAQNPKRLDLATTMQISGNVNILSIDFNWGFFFGTLQEIA